MTRKEAIVDLIAKVEGGDATAINFNDVMCRYGPHAMGAYNGSLDDAKSLHDAVLPGFGWEVGVGAVLVYKFGGLPMSENIAVKSTPARAWLLAILWIIHGMEVEL